MEIALFCGACGAKRAIPSGAPISACTCGSTSLSSVRPPVTSVVRVEVETAPRVS